MEKRIEVQIDADLREMVPGYLERRRNELPSIRQFLSAQDFENLKMMGHRLKGSAGGYGLDQIGHLGAQIENGAKAQDLAQIEQAISGLEQFLDLVDVTYTE